jgi:TolB protein
MRMRQRRAVVAASVWLAGAACWAAPSASPASPEKRLAVEVTPGKRESFNAAVQRFTDVSLVPSPERAARLRDAVSRAIEYASAFEVVDPKTFVGLDRTGDFGSRSRLACSDWTAIGADVFVEGEIEVDTSRYSARFRVWDAARCKRLLRKRYRQDASSDPKIVAKRVADDIVAAFTGVRGVASTELTFVSDRNGGKEIFLMDADGDRQRPITANQSINGFPSWSPDRNSIVFTSYRHRNRPALFVATRGRGRPERLLTRLDPDLSQYRGVFDPVGKRLAVVMTGGGPSEIYTVRPDSRKIRRITRNQSIDISPTWSPNGKRIAFASDRSGAPQIYVMDADGGNARRLTHNGSYNSAPAWSPDGKWIAYEMDVGGQFDIWLIDPEGEVNVPLITHRRSDEAPTWAPDSRKLSFSSNRGGEPDIYVIDVGGGKVRRLTERGNNTSPAWGPFPR